MLIEQTVADGCRAVEGIIGDGGKGEWRDPDVRRWGLIPRHELQVEEVEEGWPVLWTSNFHLK
jgi:hypothetical protein